MFSLLRGQEKSHLGDGSFVDPCDCLYSSDTYQFVLADMNMDDSSEGPFGRVKVVLL